MAAGWHRAAADGIEIRIRLTPKAGRDAIDGPQAAADGELHLAARVRAVPEDGKANAALVALIAKTAGVAKSRVEVIAGHTARRKTVRIACSSAEAEAIVSRLAG